MEVTDKMNFKKTKSQVYCLLTQKFTALTMRRLLSKATPLTNIFLLTNRYNEMIYSMVKLFRILRNLPETAEDL